MACYGSAFTLLYTTLGLCFPIIVAPTYGYRKNSVACFILYVFQLGEKRTKVFELKLSEHCTDLLTLINS
jgi:hypothetical protein